VGLNPEQVKCDAAAFQEAFGAGHWEEAVELYSGKLLPGVFLSHEPEFEKWLDTERARLGSEYETALEEMADAEVAVGDALRAVELCQLLVRHDPYNSRHAMRLMQASVAAEDPGNALLHARRHAELLRDELGLALPPELVALIERIRGARVEGESARATMVEVSHAKAFGPQLLSE
jgi:DNA-binding SARP family transcriptional activator